MVASSPRVLLVCLNLPGPIRGGLDLRVRGQVMALGRLGQVAVFGVSPQSRVPMAEAMMWRHGSDPSVAKTIGAAEIAAVLQGKEDPYASRVSAQVVRELNAVISAFLPDVIIISRLELGGYIRALRARGVPLILDLDEVFAPWSRSIQAIVPSPGHAALMSHFTRAVIQYEASVVRDVDCVWVSSPREARLLREQHHTETPIAVVPNCVDVVRYKTTGSQRDVDSLVFTGKFAYPPNVDAAQFLVDELMPLLPDMSLRLVGSGMPQWLLDTTRSGVEIVGAVEEITPYLASAGVVVIPLRAGGGTRLKVLEALAAEVPVISTGFGVAGLDLVPGVHYLEAHTAAEFAGAVHRLSDDGLLRLSLTAHGLTAVTQGYSIETLTNLLKTLLRAMSERIAHR